MSYVREAQRMEMPMANLKIGLPLHTFTLEQHNLKPEMAL